MDFDEVVDSLKTNDMHGIHFNLVQDPYNDLFVLSARVLRVDEYTERVIGTPRDVSLSEIRSAMERITERIKERTP